MQTTEFRLKSPDGNAVCIESLKNRRRLGQGDSDGVGTLLDRAVKNLNLTPTIPTYSKPYS